MPATAHWIGRRLIAHGLGREISEASGCMDRLKTRGANDVAPAHTSWREMRLILADRLIVAAWNALVRQKGPPRVKHVLWANNDGKPTVGLLHSLAGSQAPPTRQARDISTSTPPPLSPLFSCPLVECKQPKRTAVVVEKVLEVGCVEVRGGQQRLGKVCWLGVGPQRRPKVRVVQRPRFMPQATGGGS